MTSIATGIVEKVGVSKRGAHYIILEGVEGAFSTYKTAPNCKEGDNVEFAYQQKGDYKNADPSTIKVLATAGSSGAGQTQSSKQVSIELQSARRDAIDLVGIMVSTEAIKLPSKYADKYDALLGIVEQVTKELYTWVEDPEEFLMEPFSASDEE